MGNATTGLSSASLKKIQTLLTQREAATGRPMNKAALESLFEAELKASQQTQIQRESTASLIKTREEQLRLQEESATSLEKHRAAQLEADESAAKSQGAIDIVQTGTTGYIAYKAYAGGETAAGAQAVPELAGTSTSIQATDVGVAAGGGGTAGTLTAGEAAAAGGVGGGTSLPPATGASAAGSGSGSGAGAGSAISWTAVGIAAAVLADSAIASSVSGGFATWEERQAQNLKSFEYGGMTPGSAAILERAGIKSPVALFEEGTGIDLFQPAEDINEWLGDEIPILDEINDFFQGLGI